MAILIILNEFHFSPPRSGSEIFNSYCTSCHSSGTTGAPPIGNLEAWAARIKGGKDLLLDHAVNGYRGMPPGGTCGNCSDEELAATIEYIVKKSGGFPP